MVETWLRWFGHVERRHVDSIARRVVNSLEAKEDLKKLQEKLLRKI